MLRTKTAVRPTQTRHGRMFHDVVIEKGLKGIWRLLYVTWESCFWCLHVWWAMGADSVIIAQVITPPSLSLSVFYLVTITGKVGCYHKPV